MRNILAIRDFVIVLATKQRDDSLYKPLQKQGYKIVGSVDALKESESRRLIFKPGLSAPDASGMEEQRDAFAELFVHVFNSGGWCVYLDEIRYLTENLKLSTELSTLWLQGRSLGVTLVAGTQRPRAVPLLAFDQATHLFLWRNSDREAVRRMAEFTGGGIETVQQTVPRLPEHELLYVNVRNDRMVRTKVIV